jgi:UDP-N-acetylmuramate--alanine ligase
MTINDRASTMPASELISAARQSYGKKLIAVVQPHRYSRLERLFEGFCTCFNDADTVIVADVYAAGESPIEGVSQDALVDGIRQRGHRDVIKLGAASDLPAVVAEIAGPGDVVVLLGAGNITQWAHSLPEQLEALA